jgi:hypothetical protein
VKDLENLAGINVNKPPIHVNHADLIRASDNSIYRSDCPVCEAGVLVVGRDLETFELIAEDRCLLCAQTFIYDDIDYHKNKEIADKVLTPEVIEKLRKMPREPWNGED